MCYAGLILHEKWKGEKGRKGEGKGNRKVKLIGEQGRKGKGDLKREKGFEKGKGKEKGWER